MQKKTRRSGAGRRPAGPRLDGIVDPGHPLARLSGAIDWCLMESHTAKPAPAGRNPSETRVMLGLAVLRQLFDLNEAALFERWVENPYYQHVCGEQFFHHSFPHDRAAILPGLRRLSAEKISAMVRNALTGDAELDGRALPELSRLGIDPETLANPRGGKARKEQNGEKPVSIYDVAKRAGVSIKTVSLVINRQPNVSEQTRSAVLEAIDALSYRPNVFARGLASERSYLIGLLHDVVPGSYIADLQLGALARCREEGYHLIVELLNPLEDSNLSQRVRSLVSESVLHGVILTPPLCDERIVMEELTRARTPFVRIAPGTPIQGLPSVSIDEYKAAYEMTAYLIGLGHRRIGFVKGKPDHAAAGLRFDGYRTALADAGIAFSDELCAQGFFTYQSGLEAGERLLLLKNRPTAIFAGNDDMAAGVLAVSQRFNLNIPSELSLAGFDDSIVAQVVWPRLTTCRQPIKDMAAAAVSILAQKRTQESPPGRQLAHELVVRESTAAPPK